MNKRIQSTRNYLTACLTGVVLAACSGDETVAVSYAAYNHTDKSIVSIVINGEGGILDASAHGGGGSMCCVILPKRWRPGLMATIKWQEDDIPIFNRDGTRQFIDGVPATKESPWKKRTVAVPRYSEEELEWGTFYIHFFENDEVKVLVNKHWAGHEGHPYPHPDSDRSAKGQ